MRFPYESAHGPTQEIESWSSVPKINEWSLKEPWENYSVSVPQNQHNDKKLRELSSWPQREPQTMLPLPSFFLSKTWQRQSSALRCGLTGYPAGPIILLWVWVVTMLPPPSLEKFDAKHAKDGNVTWNKNTFSQVFWQTIIGHRSTIYIWAWEVLQTGGEGFIKYHYPSIINRIAAFTSRKLAIIKKSTQAATICKPSLLPVTFLLHVPFWDVRGMHKYTQHTSANSCNLLFYETASPSPPDPPHPFPPLYLQNGGNFGILHCWDGRKGNNPSRWTSSWKNTMVSLMPVLGWIGSDVSGFGTSQDASPSICSGSGRRRCLFFHLEGGQMPMTRK